MNVFSRQAISVAYSCLTYVLTWLAISLASLAPANADEGRGVNGGVLADLGKFHIEYIGSAADALLIFAISDESKKPIPSRDMSAFAVFAQNGESTRLTLLPEAENLLAAFPGIPLRSGTAIMVTAELGTGETLKARFISP